MHFFQIRNKTKMLSFSTFIQYNAEYFGQNNYPRNKERKDIQSEIFYLYWFSSDVLFVEKDDVSKRKILELISKFRKVAGNKINT